MTGDTDEDGVAEAEASGTMQADYDGETVIADLSVDDIDWSKGDTVTVKVSPPEAGEGEVTVEIEAE